MNMEAIDLESLVRSSAELSVCLHRGVEGLERIRQIWKSIAADAEQTGFHHQYAWYASYARHLEDEPQSLLFAVVFQGSQAVAILPLKYCPPKVDGGLRVLQLPMHPHLALADAIVRRGGDYAEIIKCALRGLRRSEAHKWDMVLFPEVLSGSFINQALQKRAGFLIACDVARSSHSIRNTAGYAAISARWSGKLRRDLRRKRRRAEASGELIYRSVEAPDELEEAFQEFLAVEGSGWKGSAGTRSAIECKAELVDFYNDLMRTRSTTMRCVINLLYLGGICIAAEFCLYHGGVLSLLKIGFLETHADVSPGNLLLDSVLRDWCERPETRAIGLVGDASWQRSWRPEIEQVFRYRLYNYTLRSVPAWLWHVLRPHLRRICIFTLSLVQGWFFAG